MKSEGLETSEPAFSRELSLLSGKNGCKGHQNKKVQGLFESELHSPLVRLALCLQRIARAKCSCVCGWRVSESSWLLAICSGYFCFRVSLRATWNWCGWWSMCRLRECLRGPKGRGLALRRKIGLREVGASEKEQGVCGTWPGRSELGRMRE